MNPKSVFFGGVQLKRYAHAMVIGLWGFPEELVLVEIDGIKQRPIGYKLLDTDRLIFEDIPKALSMVRPRWKDNQWIEAAPYTAKRQRGLV